MGIPNDLIYYNYHVCKERKYSPPPGKSYKIFRKKEKKTRKEKQALGREPMGIDVVTSSACVVRQMKASVSVSSQAPLRLTGSSLLTPRPPGQ